MEQCTGIMGDLQYEKADFGVVTFIRQERLSIIDYPSVYSNDAMIPISRKASPLPAYLAPTRPFSGK